MPIRINIPISKNNAGARITMPDSVFGAAVAAQPSEGVNRGLGNPIVSEEAADANFTGAKGGLKEAHIDGFSAFWRNK